MSRAAVATILAAPSIMITAFAGFSKVPSANPVRVACVGDSITEASGYPEYLQDLLGSDYIVRNFGASGSTALRGTYSSYMYQTQFLSAKSFTPDIIVTILGTNDATPGASQYAREFEDDYRELICEFQALKSKPKIWVVKPPPIFNSMFGPDNTSLVQSIIPSIKRVANELDIPIIDLYSALVDQPEKFFQDGVHPNPEGARAIATEVKKAITRA